MVRAARPAAGIETSGAQLSELEFYTMNEAVAELLRFMFYRFHGANKEMDKQLEEAYEKRFGHPMVAMVEADRVASTYFEGPSGHGKTSAYYTAGKEFAELLGLNFVPNPIEGQRLTQKDFYLSVISVGGAVHRMDFDGLVSREERDGKPYMTHIPGWKLSNARDAAYSLVLFDDFPTASDQVQHGLLDMTLEGHNASINFNKGGGRAQAGSATVFVAFAGNVGVRDGNRVNKITAASANRVWRVYTEDHPTDWAERTLKQFEDPIGDVYMSAFMRQAGAPFSVLPKDGVKGQFPSPRSWTMAVSYIRRCAHAAICEAGSFGFNDASIRMIGQVQKGIAGFVGKQAADAVAAFYKSIILEASPLAEEILKTGQVDVEKIRKRLNDGNDVHGQDFGYCFATAMVAASVTEIARIYDGKDDQKGKAKDAKLAQFSQVLDRFAKGIYQLDKPMISYALQAFVKRLYGVRPQMFTVNGAFYTPKEQYTKVFGEVFFDPANPYFTEELSDTVADSLSTYANFMSGQAGLAGVLNKAPALS